jgi:hypothetical protein
MGLKEQIKKANSESEIFSLLSKGKSFEFATEDTRRAWKSTAKVRLSMLGINDVVQTVQTTEISTESKKSSKKKKDRVRR